MCEETAGYEVAKNGSKTPKPEPIDLAPGVYRVNSKSTWLSYQQVMKSGTVILVIEPKPVKS
jgi:hypothetical protein